MMNLRSLLVAGLAACSLLPSAPATAPTQNAHTFAFLRLGPKRADFQGDALQDLMRQHLANIGRLAAEQKLCVAGPFASPSPEPALRGIFIFFTDDVGAAQALCQTDPSIAAGVFAAEVVPFHAEKDLADVLRRALAFEERRKANPAIPMTEGMTKYVMLFADDFARAAQALAPLRASGAIALDGAFGGSRQGQGLFLLDAREVAAAETMLAPVRDAMGAHRLFPWFGSVELRRSLPPAAACDAHTVLARATAAYQAAGALTDVARYQIRVPDAPLHQEVVEYGYSREIDFFLRMPSLYVLQAREGRLIITRDGNAGTYLRSEIGGDLQAAVDAAFAHQGPPLVPAPLLLRAARTAEDRLQAFRSKLLGRLRIAGCQHRVESPGESFYEVSMTADNGTVRARFHPTAGWLLGYDAEITPAPGQAPIEADVSFDPRPGTIPSAVPEALVQSGRQVARLVDLESTGGLSGSVQVSAIVLTALDGSTVRLADLKGSIVVLEFWASWCAPCRIALPAIAEFARWAEASGLPLRVLAVNTEERFASLAEARGKVQRYLDQAGLNLPAFVDLDASVHRSFGSGLPLTIVIDREGRVAKTHAGFSPALRESLQKTVLALSGQPSASPRQ